jgi:ATP-dependent Lon protease
MASEKGASSILMPVSCRKQLVDLSDELATKIDIKFYSTPLDALMKAMEA